MKTVTLKVPEVIDARIALLAEREGLSKSAFIREAINERIARGGAEPAGAFLEQAADLVGVVEGAEDLSVARCHLDGYGT